VQPHALEQLFVARRGGRIELRLVLVDPADGRTRTTLLAPTADPAEAVRWLGRHLAREGGVHDFRRLRVRIERAGALVDDRALAAELAAAFQAERRPPEVP
jgi:hypothetical protein